MFYSLCIEWSDGTRGCHFLASGATFHITLPQFAKHHGTFLQSLHLESVSVWRDIWRARRPDPPPQKSGHPTPAILNQWAVVYWWASKHHLMGRVGSRTANGKIFIFFFLLFCNFQSQFFLYLKINKISSSMRSFNDPHSQLTAQLQDYNIAVPIMLCLRQTDLTIFEAFVLFIILTLFKYQQVDFL